MGFSFDISVPALAVFLQGLFSFFSPCVLPLLPLYIGYLSGGTTVTGADGQIRYKKSKVMFHTLFFVIGVSFAFFLLGLGVSAVGIFGFSKVLGTERRLPFQLDTLAMSPVTALLMGFTFSFAWTPCVGPTLTSVLLMAASAESKMKGFFLIGIYTLGFVLPFLAVGLFTTSLLEFFKKHRNVVKYTVKIGGVLMILIGILMLSGKMNDVTGYLASLTQTENAKEPEDESEDKQKDTKKDTETSPKEPEDIQEESQTQG